MRPHCRPGVQVRCQNRQNVRLSLTVLTLFSRKWASCLYALVRDDFFAICTDLSIWSRWAASMRGVHFNCFERSRAFSRPVDK